MNVATLTKAAQAGSILTTPFAPVLQTYSSVMPSVFREQYLLAANAPYYLIITGTMNRIWHKNRWRWTYFWALAQYDIIFPESGENIPSKVQIEGGYDAAGRPFHQWQRTYQFPGRTRYSNARLIYDEITGCPVEIFRPLDMIHVVWDVQFEAPNTLIIRTTDYFLQIGRYRISLPSWLRGQVMAIETADLIKPDTFHITFSLAYPKAGTVFSYEGSFHLRKQPKH